MVLRHMQSVIAGCKAVLPPLRFPETSTAGENLAFLPRDPVPAGRYPVLQPTYGRKGQDGGHTR